MHAGLSSFIIVIAVLRALILFVLPVIMLKTARGDGRKGILISLTLQVEEGIKCIIYCHTAKGIKCKEETQSFCLNYLISR